MATSKLMMNTARHGLPEQLVTTPFPQLKKRSKNQRLDRLELRVLGRTLLFYWVSAYVHELWGRVKEPLEQHRWGRPSCALCSTVVQNGQVPI